LNKSERQSKLSKLYSSLNKPDYEYYPIIVKKPAKFVKLKGEFINAFDGVFSSIGCKNTIGDQEFDYSFNISLDKEEELLLVVIKITEKDNKISPITDYCVFFYKDEEERKLFLNFVNNYHIIFEPHELNVLKFDGEKKYTDEKFIKEQQKWITNCYQT
jgi:hypothetical protein